MRKIVTSLIRCSAVAAMLLGGATASEASPYTLNNGASSVDLCLPGGPACGPLGLSNWVADGNAVSGFQQWFWGSIQESSVAATVYWNGLLQALDSSGAPAVTTTASTATARFVDEGNGVGLNIFYQLANVGGVSHILETITLDNWTNEYLFVSLHDGMAVGLDGGYVYPNTTDNLVATADYTPNPEPVSMLLLGTGLVAVARSRRKNTAIA